MIRISPRRHGAALFWAITIACFLAASAGIAARVSFRAADAWSQGLRGALTVRIVAPDTQDAVVKAADAVRTAAGVYSARAVTPERAAQLLNDWAGPGIEPRDLPPLRLIEVEVDKSQATPEFARRLEKALATAGFQAEVYGPGQWVENWSIVTVWSRDVGIWLAVVMGISALLITGLAGRARAAADRTLIAPLADMGATRGQVSRIFAGRSALEGFLAGLLGAAVATAVAAWALYRFLPNMAASDWASLLTYVDAAPIVLPPILAALLAAAGARAAANRAFARAARLA